MPIANREIKRYEAYHYTQKIIESVVHMASFADQAEIDLFIAELHNAMTQLDRDDPERPILSDLVDSCIENLVKER